MCPLLAGMQSGPRMASASLCGLTNVAADKRSDDCATLRAALLLTRLQLNLGVRQTSVATTVTSDGISTDDWSLVHELALEVVNLSAAGDDAASNAASVRLLWLLDTLQEKYGPLPSLLATRADYVDRPEDREYLLLKAYEQARLISDWKNLVSIAESLASFYIEHRSDYRNGAHWLGALEENLKSFHDPL